MTITTYMHWAGTTYINHKFVEELRDIKSETKNSLESPKISKKITSYSIYKFERFSSKIRRKPKTWKKIKIS